MRECTDLAPAFCITNAFVLYLLHVLDKGVEGNTFQIV